MLASALAALALVPAFAGAAASRPPVVGLRMDRLTYTDGTYRGGPYDGFVWLGFDAARSSEAVGADVPGTRTAVTGAPGTVPEHFESVTVELRRPGDLTVVLTGRHTGMANPRAVPGSASGDGVTRGRRVVWRMTRAEPGMHTFSARFRPRAFEPGLGTFLPEARISLSTPSSVGRLILEQHVAPVYGPPQMESGRAHGSPAAHPDEWVADPGYVAEGNYSWVTGRVAEVREARFSALTGGRRHGFNSASMGSGTTIPATGAKVNAFMEFTYDAKFRATGFVHGVVTADAVGEFVPFDTRPGGGMIYDGDAADLAIGMGAASVHSREKREPNDRGRLEWDWDGAWADGWSTKDEHAAPGAERADIKPVLFKESVVYARASGGDVDNRDGSKPVRGPRLVVELPDSEFGFIFHGASYPPKTKYRTRSGFTDSGEFFMRPTIAPGGYMLEGTTNGYFRDWQAAELLSVSLFEAQPEEEPSVRRLFTFPPGTRGEIVAATTLGEIERFPVTPGAWELTATPQGFEVRPLRLFEHTR